MIQLMTTNLDQDEIRMEVTDFDLPEDVYYTMHQQDKALNTDAVQIIATGKYARQFASHLKLYPFNFEEVE